MPDQDKPGEFEPLPPQKDDHPDAPEHSMLRPMYEQTAGGGLPPEAPETLEDSIPSPAGGVAEPAETFGPESPTPDAMPQGEAAEGAAEKKEEKEEKKVRYELVESTPRAGSVVDLKFKVPYEEYDAKSQEFFKELRQTVVIDGFRKGKAPLQLLKNRYHKQVRQDALDSLFESAVAQIVAEKQYAPLRDFDRKDPEVVEGQPLEFAVSMEVRPRPEISGYDHFDLTVDTVEINDAAVEAEIEKIRRRQATYHVSEFLAWEPGHGVTLDITVRDDRGEEAKDLASEEKFFAHAEQSLPEPVQTELRGKRAGDLFTVRVPNPRKSEGGLILSENDTYTVKVREVKREVLPELTDEFVKDLGVDSVEALRAEIRRQLEEREEQKIRDEALDKVYDALMRQNPFDLPETLVQQAQYDLLREQEQRLARYGIRLSDIAGDPRTYFAGMRDRAERLMRSVVINRAIAEKENVQATEEDLDKAIAKQAEAEGRRPLAIRARLEAQKRLDQFREDLKYDLVNELLLSRATISKQYVAPESKIVTSES